DSKGYIGTGDNSSNLKKDFWEYNPTTNTWTQKTDFGGTARAGAIAFSIGSKGYMGTGYDNNENCKDFWEYDPATNVWIKKADFGGGTRYYAAGFSIGNKGYIGTGSATDFFGSWTKDFWEYDPSNNTWIKKKDFGGNVREAAVGFSIGTNGYITTGYGFGGFYYKDIWEYKTVCNGSTVYADTDHDGYGDAGNSYFAADCIVPQGYVTNSTDCNDADINIFPGAAEYCNSMDDDCDGELDENCIPINLVSSNITSNSVQLDWSFATCALSYKVIYRIKNSGAPWTNVSAPTNTLLLTGLVPGTTYSWEVKSKCGVNPSVVSDWSVKEHFTTAAMKNSKVDELHQSLQISPNPCTVDATIHFSLGTCSDNLVQSSYVTVKIFDVNGKEIQTLVNETVDSGDHSLLINTTGFAKGIYFVRMITENGIQNQKLIVQ
ncbi:MAG TPA: T9SS type A sorting domain-containing protein, partial [Chitinophagales bacterium]|nr:T9SS type A sorting domain-containing protein [Chitinophagales bacterium]